MVQGCFFKSYVSLTVMTLGNTCNLYAIYTNEYMTGVGSREYMIMSCNIHLLLISPI